MTYAAPSTDYYDDGLVHAHDWSRATPPGIAHVESRKSARLHFFGSNRETGAPGEKQAG